MGQGTGGAYVFFPACEVWHLWNGWRQSPHLWDSLVRLSLVRLLWDYRLWDQQLWDHPLWNYHLWDHP